MFIFILLNNQVLYIKVIFIEFLILKLLNKGGSIGNAQQ